jgi:hypothetical protein
VGDVGLGLVGGVGAGVGLGGFGLGAGVGLGFGTGGFGLGLGVGLGLGFGVGAGLGLGGLGLGAGVGFGLFFGTVSVVAMFLVVEPIALLPVTISWSLFAAASSNTPARAATIINALDFFIVYILY